MNNLKHTPAPWRWELNEKSKHVQLCGGIPKYDLIVMDFVRYGMGGAQPRFNIEKESGFNIMVKSSEMGSIVKGREHHADWFKSILHPDAILMQHAPEMIEALIKVNEFIKENSDKNYMVKLLDRELPGLNELIESATNLK